ncbi:UPF0598 protein CG30010 [Cimex lectularius]|uniref:Uncharacterized protein n=1 Tax=Cimex lectularius TaxID=79782 RepID=A0A8I6TJR1_CIMLE|nr:UPF0598 protein CG30010 [Cimex lectularius]
MILKNTFKILNNNARRLVHYVQGQTTGEKNNIREYFYYIDHQGMLFLDDSKMKNFTSCFKDKEFLEFFFKRIRPNVTERYLDFPYISLCGRERNYIRVDDTPLVYSQISSRDGKDVLLYNHAGDKLFNDFVPQNLFMSPATGRIYHPCQEKYGSVGLIISKIAIELSKLFTFENGEDKPPTKFEWKGAIHELDFEWYFKYRPQEK